MKFSLAVVLAAALSTVSADKTPFEIAKWCCQDSNEKCGDACAYVADCAVQLEFEMPLPCKVFPVGRAIDGMNPFGYFSTVAEVPAACRENTHWECCDAMDGYVCGDPHFKTWGGLEFDYQGECDLKFLSAPHFAKGLGLIIHIRTDIKNDYSFISSAAIQIGDSVIEIGAWGEYIVNGVENADMPAPLADGIEVVHEMKSKKTHVFTIDVGSVSDHGDARLKIQTFKEWVSIHIEHPQHSDYDDSTGMLGSFPKGVRFGRDGVTVIEDDNAFGQEWQVLPEEQGLFQGRREPQHPSQCVLPQELAVESGRRLAESKVSEKEAREACAHLEAHQEFCVHDVMASGDLEMAGAGAF